MKPELEFGNLRIDSLAFEAEDKSLVIIEYKINQRFIVIEQGDAYLSLLLDNKAVFILEYKEHKSKQGNFYDCYSLRGRRLKS